MSARVKVLHFTTTALPSPYLAAIADHTDRGRFDVTVMSLAPRGPVHDDIDHRGLRTLALGCTSRRDYPGTIVQLARWLHREQIDVIQTHLFDGSVVGLAAARLAGTRLAVFTGHHSHEVPLHLRRSLLWADMLCSRWLAHRIIAPCHQMKEIFVRDEGVPAEKIAAIPYGFDFSRWQPRSGAGERVRRELGLGEGVVLGAVGRLFWVKNYPVLFEAFGTVAAADPALRLLVLGDGPERAAVTALVGKLGLRERVVVAGHRDDAADALAAIDVLVHASLAESFGQVIVEAMALGKPVVSTPVGIAPEIVEDGVNGFLARGFTAAQVAEALIAALAARSRWPEMGKEGQRRAQQFSAALVVPRYEAQYLAWLEARSC